MGFIPVSSRETIDNTIGYISNTAKNMKSSPPECIFSKPCRFAFYFFAIQHYKTSIKSQYHWF